MTTDLAGSPASQPLTAPGMPTVCRAAFAEGWAGKVSQHAISLLVIAPCYMEDFPTFRLRLACTGGKLYQFWASIGGYPSAQQLPVHPPDRRGQGMKSSLGIDAWLGSPARAPVWDCPSL